MLKAFIVEYHSDIIAIFALLITIGQLIISLYKKRMNLVTEIENVDQEDLGKRKECVLVLTIINKSTAAINISRILMKNKSNEWISCRYRKAPVFMHQWPTYPETDIPSSERSFSTDFPISINGRGSTCVVVVFSYREDVPDFKDGETIELKLLTDKKDVHCECKCKICSDNELATFY